ncbi:restriction endonuclease subunit S, partial [Mycoplasma tauri]|uniref:restriction endonuclease subunit S n=1 Tax=Mycoplasma tauri TaxID=547987 RepID=UPI00280BA81B
MKGEQVNKKFLSNSGSYYVLNGGVIPSGFISKYNTPINTISISEGGNSCGFVNFNNKPFWSGGHNYSLLKPQISVLFLYNLLKNSELNIMNLRTGSGLPNIQKKSLEQFLVKFPDNNEQLKISSSLTYLNDIITLHQRKLEKLKNIKNMLLEKMFADEKTLKPGIRFKEFTNDWEQRRVGDLLTTLSCREYIREPEQGGKYEIIQQGDNPILGFCSGSAFPDYKNVIIFGDHTVSLFLPKR